MRRTLTMLALAACVVVAAAVPAVATAHHGHKRHTRISGTVASFDKGILAIKKANGDVVTGEVTGKTEFECENDNENEANDSRVAHASHDGGGDDNEGDRQEQGDANDNENEDQAGDCGTAQLTPGAVVSRARMRDRHNQTVWKNVKLAQ